MFPSPFFLHKQAVQTREVARDEALDPKESLQDLKSSSEGNNNCGSVAATSWETTTNFRCTFLFYFIMFFSSICYSNLFVEAVTTKAKRQQIDELVAGTKRNGWRSQRIKSVEWGDWIYTTRFEALYKQQQKKWRRKKTTTTE